MVAAAVADMRITILMIRIPMFTHQVAMVAMVLS